MGRRRKNHGSDPSSEVVENELGVRFGLYRRRSDLPLSPGSHSIHTYVHMYVLLVDVIFCRKGRGNFGSLPPALRPLLDPFNLSGFLYSNST